MPKYIVSTTGPAPDLRRYHRLRQQDKQFPPARFPTEILFKSCLRCGDGDLTWNIWLCEWNCLACGWFEFEDLLEDETL